MSLSRQAAVGGCLTVAALGAVLAGCGSSPTTASGGTASSTAGASRHAASSGATGGATAATTPTTGTAATPTGAAGPAAHRCTSAHVAARFVTRPHGSGQYRTVLEFVNHGTSPCTMTGFPGFELVGPRSNGTTTYDPIRQTIGYRTVTLAPAGAAHSVFTALTGPDSCDNGRAWQPTTVTVILPGGTHRTTLRWPGGTVDNCQGGATHPGTYIGPVEPGA